MTEEQIQSYEILKSAKENIEKTYVEVKIQIDRHLPYLKATSESSLGKEFTACNIISTILWEQVDEAFKKAIDGVNKLIKDL